MKKIVNESLVDFMVSKHTNNILDSYFNGNIKSLSKLEESLYTDLYDILDNAGVMNEGMNIKEMLSNGEGAVIKWLKGISNSMKNNKGKLAEKGGEMLAKIQKVIKKVVSKFPKAQPKAMALLLLMTFTIINSSLAKAGTVDNDINKNNTEQTYDGGSEDGGGDVDFSDAEIRGLLQTLQIAFSALDAGVGGLEQDDVENMKDSIKTVYKVIKSGGAITDIDQDVIQKLLKYGNAVESSVDNDVAQDLNIKGHYNLNKSGADQANVEASETPSNVFELIKMKKDSGNTKYPGGYSLDELHNAFLEYQDTKSMPDDPGLAQSMMTLHKEFKSMQ